MHTIKGRILLAFAALCLLTTPVILFYFSSSEKINLAHNIKEQVDVFNINRLKLLNVYNQILESDSKLDAFYLESSTSNIKKYQQFYAKALNALVTLKENQQLTSQVVELRLETIEQRLTLLNTNVNELIRLKRKRGFKDYGLEGNMRSQIHQLENATSISLSENLMLRRREKDFFLRGDLHYANLLNQHADSLIERMAANFDENHKAIIVLNRYKEIFNDIVKIESAIGNENAGLVYNIHELSNQLDQDVESLHGVLKEDLTLLSKGIRNFIILFLLITILFLVAFAFIFSNYITKPIKLLIEDMDRVIANKFKTETAIQTKSSTQEILQLKTSYTKLTETIKDQVNALNLKNAELERLNGKLKESEVELKDASQIKDKFFSIISHDLKGYTSNIVSMTQVLNANTKLTGEERQVFGSHLQDTAQNLQLLLDNLLNWAKNQMNDKNLNKRSFDINKVLEKNVELIREVAIRKNITLNIDHKAILKGYADKDMVDFVVRNLLSNALKFTPEGESIIVTATEKEHELAITIKDTGVGMTKTQIKELLNANKQAKSTKGTNNEEGNGLGFGICLDFIKRNGGKIIIDSKVGVGSSFTFTIPTQLSRTSILN